MTAPTRSSGRTSLGERFARTLAAQDGTGLKALLAPNVHFRALTPGGYWECEDAAAAVDDVILGVWFPPERPISQLIAFDCATVGPVERIGYRLRAELSDGELIVEQQGYLRIGRGRISSLRILCSGFVHEH